MEHNIQQDHGPAAAPAPPPGRLHKLRTGLKTFYRRLGRFSWLEIIGLAAIAVIILDQFFALSITISRKPLLQKMLGQETASSLPPQLSGAANQPSPAQPAAADPALMAEVIPAAGITLPVAWGSLGKQLLAAGVIDQQKFEALYAAAGGLPAEQKALLQNSGNGKLTISSQNAGVVLNLLWALGLGNKNPILNEDMKDPKYGGDPGKFASTGGWTLARGDAMQHYGMHGLVSLTAAQQALVAEVAANIYRPCCNNSTHLPDCNHGLAMLGLLELMASQGVAKTDMYKYALAVNSYWFPDNYLTMAAYFKKQGTNWSAVDPKLALSAQYSSAQGYQQLLQQVAPQTAPQSRGGCGVS
ncbi:MAG TPA: hypothetical protein VHA30_02465 [Patescibacteria group bacterium]|nr:hypothetical protein [Patescibacteria group bacterium]